MSNSARVFKKSKAIASDEFLFILSQICKCYYLMLEDNKLLENDEGIIRNHLHKDYLDNQLILEKLELNNFFFDIEYHYVDDNYKETGRNDIKIYDPKKRLKDRQSPYYIIECKRLENTNIGKGSLNYEYVKEGIERFKTREDYPSFLGKSGIIGFIVKKLNIKEMIFSINQLLEDSEKLIKYDKLEYPDISFYSEHSNYKNNKLELHHLMFDFSSLII